MCQIIRTYSENNGDSKYHHVQILRDLVSRMHQNDNYLRYDHQRDDENINHITLDHEIASAYAGERSKVMSTVLIAFIGLYHPSPGIKYLDDCSILPDTYLNA